MAGAFADDVMVTMSALRTLFLETQVLLPKTASRDHRSYWGFPPLPDDDAPSLRINFKTEIFRESILIMGSCCSRMLSRTHAGGWQDTVPLSVLGELLPSVRPA